MNFLTLYNNARRVKHDRASAADEANAGSGGRVMFSAVFVNEPVTFASLVPLMFLLAVLHFPEISVFSCLYKYLNLD
jgi:hypothetical protein